MNDMAQDKELGTRLARHPEVSLAVKPSQATLGSWVEEPSGAAAITAGAVLCSWALLSPRVFSLLYKRKHTLWRSN